MRRIPVDPALTFVLIAIAEYIRDGQRVSDPTSGPLSTLSVLTDPEPGGRPEVFDVRVPERGIAAGLERFSLLQFDALVARPYSFADGGQTRSGVSYSASGADPVATSTGPPAAPASGGPTPHSPDRSTPAAKPPARGDES